VRRKIIFAIIGCTLPLFLSRPDAFMPQFAQERGRKTAWLAGHERFPKRDLRSREFWRTGAIQNQNAFLQQPRDPAMPQEGSLFSGRANKAKRSCNIMEYVTRRDMDEPQKEKYAYL